MKTVSSLVLADTKNEKSPSKPVIFPFVVLAATTVAPISGSFVSESKTFPLILKSF